jgi:neutral amino acid transport system permease protein
MRAISDNPQLAMASGIDTEKILLWVWFIGGGIGSFYGAIIAAYLLGFSENIGVAILSELSISTGYRPAIAFIILIFVLVLRPSGIMGKKEGN